MRTSIYAKLAESNARRLFLKHRRPELYGELAREKLTLKHGSTKHRNQLALCFRVPCFRGCIS